MTSSDLKLELEHIANEIGATLAIKEESIRAGGGAHSPELSFLLKITHHGHVIRIHIHAGTTAVGKVECLLPKLNQSLEFEITTVSHFVNLFLRKGGRFRIESKNEEVKTFFNQSIGLAKMRGIAKKDSFDPLIYGKNRGEEFRLITEYHLQFDNYWEVIKPIILFNKEFINLFV